MADYRPTLQSQKGEVMSLETSGLASVGLSSLGRLAQSYMSDEEEEA